MRFIKRYKKAMEIYKIAEEHALDKTYDLYPRSIKDFRVGVHLTDDHHVNDIRDLIGYNCPIRWHDTEIHELVISLPAYQRQIVQLGNEWENDIGKKQLSAKEWKQKVIAIAKAKKRQIPSPSLMTIKQYPKWRELIEVSPHISDWCMNFHVPGFMRARTSGPGDYWECLKHIANLIEFEEKTNQPIIITEFGVGQTHLLYGPDLKFVYIILDQVFGSRMLACLAYDSDLVRRNNALDVFKQKSYN